MIPELLIARTPVTAETLEQYLQFLTKQRIKRIGRGLSSAVFNHPTMPNVAVKMIVSKDPYYLRYVEFCKKNPGNPWLPKILGGPETRILDFEKDGVSAAPVLKQKVIFVFLEKLKPATFNDIKASVTYFSTLASLNSGLRFFADFGPGDWSALAKQTKDKNVAALASFLVRFDYDYLDLHKGNFMMRGRQLVFLDPVSPGTPTDMLVQT